MHGKALLQSDHLALLSRRWRLELTDHSVGMSLSKGLGRVVSHVLIHVELLLLGVAAAHAGTLVRILTRVS